MKFKELTSGTKRNYLKIESGKEVRGVFRGDPVDFYQHWTGGRGVVCPGRDTCALCKQNEKASFRFRINFVVNENGAYVAKVFESGRPVYEALRALSADYDLETYLMKIIRAGSGTDTKYSIIPAPKGDLNEEQKRAISAITLETLVDGAPPPHAVEDEPGDEHEVDDIPF